MKVIFPHSAHLMYTPCWLLCVVAWQEWFLFVLCNQEIDKVNVTMTL